MINELTEKQREEARKILQYWIGAHNTQYWDRAIIALAKILQYEQLESDRDALLEALRARVDDCECYPAGDDCYECQDNNELIRQVESH